MDRLDGAHGSELRFSSVFNVAVPFIDRHIAEGRGDKVAILTTDEELTYGHLAQWVDRCGNGLLSRGVRPGDRLLMIVKDCPEFFFLFWGAIKAGICPVPVNTLLRSTDYQYLLEDSTATALAYSPELAAEVEPALAASAHQPTVVLLSNGGHEDIRTLFRHQPSTLDAVPSTPDEDAFWLYSSGSTGRPKGVVHAHRSLAVTSQRYAVEVLKAHPDDIFFSAAKLFFAYGLGNALSFPLWVGGTAVLMPERPTPEGIFQLIESFRPSLYFGVPTLYAAMLQTLESSTPDVSSLRLCVSAGEALPGDLLRRFQERVGLPILDGIGSTEALHIFLSNRPEDIRAGSSGREVPGYRARIRDETGQDVQPGKAGRLMIQGASTAGRYWNHPEKTTETMVDGWLDTGDTYQQDEEGYFVYCGRSDDMLKVGGIWCSPFEIEAKLTEHPEVHEVAVVGRQDEHGLTKPEAWVVLRHPEPAGDDLAQELLDHCQAGLARYKYPRWFHWVEELPKTATGKIQRFRLRHRADDATEE